MSIELVSGSRGVEQMVTGGRATLLHPARPTVFLAVFTYGGIEHYTFEGLLREMRMFDTAEVNFALHSVHGDALISRSRSKAFSVFMDAKDDKDQPLFDVCIMLDHDMQWQPGALLGLARKAKETQAMVAGIYSCRGIGCGAASRTYDPEVRYKAGEDKLIDAEYLATGFMAIPRVVGEEVLKEGLEAAAHEGHSPGVTGLDMVVEANKALHSCMYNDKSPFHDYFRPIVVPNTTVIKTAAHEYLSEDWAFCWRARQANPDRKFFAWTLPMLVHHGSYGYTMATAYAGKK